MGDDEELTPSDVELAELEATDLSDVEVQHIRRSQRESAIPADDPEVS
jgi:hypothetical protein